MPDFDTDPFTVLSYGTVEYWTHAADMHAGRARRTGSLHSAALAQGAAMQALDAYFALPAGER